MNKKLLELHFIVILLAFTAILGRLCSLSSIGLVFWRTLFAGLGLLILLFYNKINVKLSVKDTIQLVWVGIILGLHWICFFYSAKVSTVAISLVTFSFISVFTSLLKPFFIKNSIKPQEVLLGLLATGGMALILGFEYKYITGILFGLASAFLAAVFSLYNARLTNKHPSQLISFYEIATASVLMALIMLFKNGAIDVSFNGLDLLWVMILGLVCTVYPHAKMIELLKSIDVFTANLSLNLEPVYGIIMAYLIFGNDEKMSLGFYIGTLVLLGSVILDLFLKPKVKI